MQASLQFLILDERGQGLVEYALIIALVAVAAFSALTFLGVKTNASLTTSAALLSS